VRTSQAMAPGVVHRQRYGRIMAIDRLDDPKSVDPGRPWKTGSVASSSGTCLGLFIFPIYPGPVRIASKLAEFIRRAGEDPTAREDAPARRIGGEGPEDP
jgi:hypothetical protein